MSNRSDPTTQSNYLEATTEHVYLDWMINFGEKTIHGSAMHSILIISDHVDKVMLDTLDLEINSVGQEGKSLSYSLGERHPIMGSALTIYLPPTSKGSKINVQISYKVTDKAVALQFLEKEQTQGKQFPYLFSQCQPIYARSLAPLQDTPSVKFTYSANVASVFPVLMSAIREFPPSDGPPHSGKEIGKDVVVYAYNQPVPIPSYLLAIASGNVRYRAFPKAGNKGWTSGVWAEPEFIDAAYWEFSADTDRFLSAEENIVGSYRFGVYDLLVLPASFPYGGMENACCTFLTPTLLTGDRALVDVVIHELTHSWFGNGVTHTDATHFWLNEGITTYMERVLLQVVHSPAHRGLSYLIGFKDLRRSLEQFASRPKFQRLLIDFAKGENPDDAYSTIPYEKGANLLLYLERILGGLDVFLPYIKDYVASFSGKSIDTDIWKAHLYEYWGKVGGSEKIKILSSVNWNAWFFGEGLALPVELEYDATLAYQAYELAARWDASRGKAIDILDFEASDIGSFDTNQKVVFLERLQTFAPLPAEHTIYLGELYGLSKTLNSEVRFSFYEYALLNTASSNTKQLAIDAVKWVVGDDGTNVIKGRMKFCRPLFRAVNRIDANLAISTFQRHMNSFHPIARRLIEQDLGLA